MRRFILCLFLSVFLFPGLCWCFPTQTVMVKMTDGTELATDIYLPKEGGPAWPVIVARSAYPRGIAMGEADEFIKKGYAGVVQDIRGMGHSKGERSVFRADGWMDDLRDGPDTISWIKQQPWCNGKVATFGPSALGITQVLMAPVTKDLACQYIAVAPSNFYFNLVYQGGVWKENLVEGWLTLLNLKPTIPLYKSHPYYDDFWTYYNAEDRAGDITAPAMHVGGWYDIFQQGTLRSFITRQNNGGPGAKGNQKLIMKASAHNGDDQRDYKVKPNRGDLKIGALRDAFLEYWLKGIDNGIMKEPTVHYYVMGDDRDPNAPGNEWRSADTWPPFPTVETPYFLREDGALATDLPATEGTRSYVFDPKNPVSTHGGANLFIPAGPFDQRRLLDGRNDILRFVSEPLAEPTESTGQIFVRLYVSTDAPDTDFSAKLVDVFPSGDDREILMLDGIQRVKLRESFEKPCPLLTSPDQVVEIKIDLWSISWVFNKGHRVGLHVSSSNKPRFAVNPNTGEDFPKDGVMRTANNMVHMGGKYPSAVLLPVKK